MTTIKSYTDIEQSKKLTEILPLESADMVYIWHATSDNPTFRFDEDMPPMVLKDVPINEITADTLPCWSLVALLEIIPGSELSKSVDDIGKWEASAWKDPDLELLMRVEGFDNPIDACYDMILKLHEFKIL